MEGVDAYLDKAGSINFNRGSVVVLGALLLQNARLPVLVLLRIG
jgi:hypothetical protein